MRVIPSAAVLSSSPRVRDSIIWSGRTLGDRDDAVLVIGVVLTDTVPVNTSTVLGVYQVVRHMDSDGVAPVCKYCRARDGTINSLVQIIQNIPFDIPIDSHG